jgi:hypothetical protein
MMSLISGTVDIWKNLSVTVKVIGAIGVVTGAIYSSAQAWPTIEPYWYAHRGYVRYYDDQHIAGILTRVVEVRLAQVGIQLAQNDERRQRLIDESAKRELELQSDQAKQLPQYRSLVQERVDRIKSELKTLEEQDNNLFKEQKALGGH